MKINAPKVAVGDKKVLKVEFHFPHVTFEKGDVVEVIGIGERGYDIVEVNTGTRLVECGWDIFE